MPPDKSGSKLLQRAGWFRNEGFVRYAKRGTLLIGTLLVWVRVRGNDNVHSDDFLCAPVSCNVCLRTCTICNIEGLTHVLPWGV